jgi:hypothetical protein
MSYLECPDCGKTINIFGESNVDEVAKNNGIKVLAKLPLTPNNTLLADGGNTDKINTEKVDSIVELIEKL